MPTLENNCYNFDFNDLYQLSENDLYEKIGEYYIPYENEYRQKDNKVWFLAVKIAIFVIIVSLTIYCFICYPSLILWLITAFMLSIMPIAISLAIIFPACNRSREKARKHCRINMGKEIFYRHLPQIQVLLCKNGEPRFIIQEITSGEIRNIASMLLSAISIPEGIVYYFAMLILKLGLNKFCALSFEK